MRSYTVAIIKPDGIEKKLVGRILGMAGKMGLYPIELEFFYWGRTALEEFYAEHVGKPFFDAHAALMMSGPSLVIYFVHDTRVAFSVWRELMGATDPTIARVSEALDEKKSIRALWGEELPRNVVHGSDSEDSVIREAAHLHLMDWFNYTYKGEPPHA